jgi:hypothetical protein
MNNNILQQKPISIDEPSIMDQKVWFLEYSTYQKCFHIDTLDEILYKNRDTCRRGVCPGYVIIDGPMVYNDLYDSMKKWNIQLELITTTLEGYAYKAQANGTFIRVPKKDDK